MSIIEELRELSDKDSIERSFMHYIEEAKQIAMAGKREMTMNIMKKSFFEEQIKPGADVGAFYDSQYKIIQKFMDEGFTVTEEKPSPIIIANVSESAEDEFKRDFEQRYLESKIKISW